MVRRALDAIPRPVKAKPLKGVGEAAAPLADGAAAGKNRGKGVPSVPVIRGETMALRVRAYGSALFGWATKRGLVAINPFAGLPMDAREVERDRALNDAELAEVWRAIGKLAWPWGSYLRFLLLTLQRQAETAALEWAELAPGFATWELPGNHTKNRKPHLVHLAGPARAILEAAPRLPGSPLVFTTGDKLPLTGFAHAKARLDTEIIAARAKLAAEAGDGRAPEPLVPWRLHDFRRTGVTVLARLGVRWEVADRLLNHVQGAIHGVARVYQRHDYLAEREAALDQWAAHVLAVGEGAKAGTNVVELRRAGMAEST
jgi:integrase